MIKLGWKKLVKYNDGSTFSQCSVFCYVSEITLFLKEKKMSLICSSYYFFDGIFRLFSNFNWDNPIVFGLFQGNFMNFIT